MGKQMEGDNVERRKRAKEAREEGKDPSAEMVTLGASKQHATLPTPRGRVDPQGGIRARKALRALAGRGAVCCRATARPASSTSCSYVEDSEPWREPRPRPGSAAPRSVLAGNDRLVIEHARCLVEAVSHDATARRRLLDAGRLVTG